MSSTDEDVLRSLHEGKAFTVTTGINDISGYLEHPYLYLKNPSGSTLDIRITHFKFGVDGNDVRTVLKIYSNPTVTADGTALVETNTLITASPVVAVAETFKDPTVTSNGSILDIAIAPADSPSNGINRFYIIQPGNSILITIQNSSSNSSTFANIYWLEV